MAVKVLGKAAIEAAQALSEKFGIATFDLSGKVNTIPLTKPYNQTINIGTGSTGLTSSALNKELAKLTSLVQTKKVIYDPFVNSPKDIFTPAPEQDKTSGIVSQIQPYSGYLVLGAAALLALTLLKRA